MHGIKEKIETLIKPCSLTKSFNCAFIETPLAGWIARTTNVQPMGEIILPGV
jgi:hypothetical protein